MIHPDWINPQSFADELARPQRAALLRLVLVPLLFTAAALFAGRFSYLLFHTLAELFSVIIAVTAAVVATTSYRFTRNQFIVFVALALGWCAALDLLHLMSFQGMRIMPSTQEDLTVKFWIAARGLQALTLLAAPLFFFHVSVPVGRLHLAGGLVSGGLAYWVFSGHFPTMFVPGQGLTPLKIWAEYAIIALLLASVVVLWLRRALMTRRFLLGMQMALLCMALSEYLFTQYVDMHGLANELGHVLKIFAFWFIYLALVHATLREPFSMLARGASTYEAVPDPVCLLDHEGRILQANEAAARHAGRALTELVGCHVHDLFHAPEVAREACPVCIGIQQGRALFEQEVVRGQGRQRLECRLVPFKIEHQQHGYVHMARDVTERQRLTAERETLVRTLGERIKELRCLHAVSHLLEREEPDVPTLLGGVARLLPPGFLRPEDARAAFVGHWGRIGSPAPPSPLPSSRVLQRKVFVHEQPVGLFEVFYPVEVTGVDSGESPFLPEERELLSTVAQRVGEAIERQQSRQQIKRLSYLYDMLSATNRAVLHCRQPEELLAAMAKVLLRHGAFPLFAIATTESDGPPFRLLHAHGTDAAHQAALQAQLAAPAGPVMSRLNELRHGKVQVPPLPVADGQGGWHDYLHAQGLRARALLPLVCEGRLEGLVVLFADDPQAFDAGQVRLLDEMAADLAFALEGMAVARRDEDNARRAAESEYRFHELFMASPTPMQIQSIHDKTLRGLNVAHQQWLGYAPQEVATEDAWFTHIYPDPALRREVRAHWDASVARASATGEAVQSPELHLRGKDGGERIARGTMKVVGDEALIAWTDLTDIRRGEQALRESEQHFRGLVEQTFTGVYVSRDDRMVYVNPRVCEILGWSQQELVGRDLLEVIQPDAASAELIRQERQRLRAGERSVSLSLPVRRKDGRLIELGLHATQGTWDGATAFIVMVQDITERKHAEEKIADYIKRLEVAMRGTLQAVSAMVDLRDPYTAGHERRVGQIASAIAAELGWPAERCQTLELIGLVHDIGKIAVPAEILAKPGRLSEVEMALVKGHARAGYEILKDVLFDFPVAETIYQHHERLDGSGYPRGLRGEAILPEARILAVADVLESMFSHRPYRTALGLAAALAELERGRGMQYDAQVVDAVQRLVRDKGYVLPE